jgi:hypothetical protein
LIEINATGFNALSSDVTVEVKNVANGIFKAHDVNFRESGKKIAKSTLY